MNRFLLHQLLLIILILFISQPLLAQNQNIDERLFEWMENNSREQLQQRLEKIRRQYSDSPIPLYLEAYLEIDGSKAATIYEKVAKQFPDSPYGEAAMMKLGQYFFVTQSYQRARFWFDKLAKKFSKSINTPNCRYFSAVCSRLLGDKKTAEKGFKKFLKKYPDHLFADDARKALEKIHSDIPEAAPSMSVEPIENFLPQSKAPPESETLPFAVQIGAFKDHSNAVRLKKKYAFLKYSVRIVPRTVGDGKLYLVQVGSFAGREQAEQVGRFLQERYELQFRVVKQND